MTLVISMLTLHHERSYLWLFPIFGTLFIANLAASVAITGSHNWGFIALPFFFLWILAAQLKSGVALDSRWKATHLQGSAEYQIHITWNVIVLLVTGGMAFVAITSQTQN